jgi:photosystem II stability/assembly factor-like uncharacterized protein
MTCAVIGIAPVSLAAANNNGNVLHVADTIPVQGPSQVRGAYRPQSDGSPAVDVLSPNPNPWKLQAKLPGTVIHDLAFPTSKVGYAAAELGQVWKTTDGGAHWTEIMNLGFPYYWYGVYAFDANNVAISGFIDNNWEGVLRWSHDGGATWSSDVVLTTTGWSLRTRFANHQDGLVMDLVSLVEPNAAHYTTDGGAMAGDWTAVVPDPNGGWFGNEFSMLKDLRTRASGITYCDSSNGGINWICRPSIDSVFDGPVFFANDNAGWVGGGEISPLVEGWVHRTTDGGKTWSGRTLDISWPVREIYFLNPTLGWAAGGNWGSGVGGIYFSSDGGQTWSLDLTSNAEMDACATSPAGPSVVEIWCAGYDSSLSGVIYKLQGLAH